MRGAARHHALLLASSRRVWVAAVCKLLPGARRSKTGVQTGVHGKSGGASCLVNNLTAPLGRGENWGGKTAWLFLLSQSEAPLVVF